MTEYVEVNGCLIDPDTGEIVQFPAAGDRLSWLAANLAESQEQLRLYEKGVGALKRAIEPLMPAARITAGDVTLSRRQGSRREFDAEAYQAWLDEAELTGAEMLFLLRAARAFNLDAIEEPYLRGLIEGMIRQIPNRAYIVAERVRRPANVRVVTIDREAEA